MKKLATKDLSLYEKIRIAMGRKGYTFQKLAEELGISVGYLSDIVRGNRSGGDYMDKLKRILEISDPKK